MSRNYSHCAAAINLALILNMHAVSALNVSPVAVPTGLQTEISFDGASVFLSWIDNSDDETGFMVERASGSGVFSPIAAKGANVGAYTDTNPPLGLVSWRVKAIRNNESSAYCTPFTVTITGQPTFAITCPKQGDSVVNSGLLVIKWFVAAGVTLNSVLIKLSIDDGLSWQDLCTDSALEASSPDWGNWSWHIPADMVSDNAMVRVHEYGDYGRGVTSGTFRIVQGTVMVRNHPRPKSAPLKVTRVGKNARFCLPKNAQDLWNLAITDIKGAVVFSHTGNSGETIPWNSGSVPAGRYIAYLSSNTMATSESFIVVH